MISQARNTAVVWRETTRSARRWQTYAARSGFSALLLGVLVFGIWSMTFVASQDLLDNDNAPLMGRALFITFTVIQMLIGLLMAPVVTAKAVIEERIEGTLDLMVLTPLSGRQLLTGKVAARLLWLGTIVLGSLPLLALAVTLGGVAVTEVVLATLGNAVSLVVMGALGAFFGLFTRSPMLALLASAGWAFLAFLLLPAGFALLVGDTSAMAHISPFFASAGTWSGLLLSVTWIPTVVLIWVLAGRLFELSAARASLHRYFEGKVWFAGPAAVAGALFVVSCFALLPFGVAVSWISVVSTGLRWSLVWWLGWAVCFGWTQLLVLLCTWAYLRLGMDLVDAVEGMLTGLGRSRGAWRKQRGTKIWSNPVAWRESQISGWGRGALPLLVIWTVVAFTILQTGLWIIPGGVLGIGLVNTVLALLLTLWSSVGSIEQERKGRSLDMLRVSTLSDRRIIVGKLMGIGAPTLPLIAISCLLLIIGLPHAGLLSIADRPTLILELVARGVLSSIWLVVFWGVVALGGMALALRLRNPSTAYMVWGGTLFAYLMIPTFLAWTLSALSFWLTLPFRILVPPLVSGSPMVEHLVGTALLLSLAIGLYLHLVRNLRASKEHP
ncbi:MAG: hypothetical protein EA397_13470 [Deltaproteobacteria bacterium]|nr:MAG: hypothetical protein EA397_13470 [Deltaproteobacteria bacterium]